MGVLLTTLDDLGLQMFKNQNQENSHYLNEMVSGYPFVETCNFIYIHL